MASRESQGLQISLILFVMVSVVLAVLTFVFYRSWQGARAEAEDWQKKQQVAVTQSTEEHSKVEYLKHVLGAKPLPDAQLTPVKAMIGGDAEMKAIEAEFSTDMAAFGEGLPPEQRNYRALPRYLMNALVKKNEDNSDLNQKVNQLINEKTALEKSERERAEEAVRGQQTASEDLAKQNESFRASLAEVNKMRQDELNNYREQLTNLRNETAAAISQRDDERGKLRQSELTVEDQKKRIEELVDQPFEVPDGRIVAVNQQLGLVLIDLGSADGLRRQTTFSVFDQDALNIAAGRGLEEDGDEEDAGLARQADNAKAKIEVTLVRESHLAEGRIVDDTPADPIMPGDQIYSPAWKPGQRVGFALAGTIDIDGDRRDDQQLLRNIISMGGGEVHEQPTPSTRYLVLGDEPLSRAGQAQYSTAREQAATLGIQSISLPILLDLMGYKAEVTTTSLGRRRSERRDDEEGEDEFRPRRPPAADSAF